MTASLLDVDTTGLFVEFWPTGKIKQCCEYVQGRPVGWFSSFWLDGRPYIKYYINDRGLVEAGSTIWSH